jgi:hypothetical protein
VTVPTRTGETITVIAQSTNTPGLVVTPQLGDSVHGGRGFTGYWGVTHATSGTTLPVPRSHFGLDVHTAVRVGDALGETGVDWTVGHDELVGLLQDTELLAAVRAAVKRGMFPVSTGQWDGDKAVGPGGYPDKFEQATARQMAGYYTRRGLQRFANNWELMRYDRKDPQARSIYVHNLEAMFAEYAAVHLLRAFAAVDTEAADAAARDLWEALTAGDGLGEWLAEWGTEYGVPVPEADPAAVGVNLPDPVSYDQVMATKLLYQDSGTIGSMRQVIAKTAARGQGVYGRIADRIVAGAHSQKYVDLTDDDRERHLLAHGTSFYGWSLVALLGWLAKEYPHLAVVAGRMVDDIGTNGGNDYCEDINLSDGEEPEPAPPTDTADQITQ